MPRGPAGLGDSAKLLNGDIACVQLPGFYPGAADVVLQAIPTLATGVKLHGLILDLRGNGGGSPAGYAAGIVDRLENPAAHRGRITFAC